MAQQAQAIQQLTRDSTPAIRVGPLDGDVQQKFDSMARRAFEIFEKNGGLFGHDLTNWLRAEHELFHVTHVDVSESDRAFTVRTEVPGFTVKDLEINIEGGRLTIAGKRETKQERNEKKIVYPERCSDQVLRAVDFQADVDAGDSESGQEDFRHCETRVPAAAVNISRSRESAGFAASDLSRNGFD